MFFKFWNLIILLIYARDSHSNGEKLSSSLKGLKLIRIKAPEDIAEGIKVSLNNGTSVFDIWKERIHEGYVFLDVLASPQQIELIQSSDRANITVLLDNVQRLVEEEEKNDRIDEVDLEGRPISDIRWDKYYDLDVMYDYLEKLEITYPFKNYIRIEEIGKSYEGLPIKMARIHNYINGSAKNSINRVFIDGGTHAREWISPAVALYIIYLLVERHEDHKDLLNSWEWLIVPVVNPDGYQYSRKNNRMWRKSRRKNGQKEECLGVDLNRNYGFRWREENNNVEELSNPCSELYSGSTPFSEPETQAIHQTVMKYKDSIKSYFSLHSYGQLWTFPWSYKLPNRESADYYNLYIAAEKAVKSLEARYGTKYIFGSSSELSYLSSGTSDDWMYGEVCIQLSFTIELRDEEKFGFLLPSAYIVPTAEETFDGMLAIIKDIKG